MRKSTVFRWIILLIATWSVFTVWAEDPLARTAGGPHTRFYWAFIFVIALITAAGEIWDWYAPRSREQQRAED